LADRAGIKTIIANARADIEENLPRLASGFVYVDNVREVFHGEAVTERWITNTTHYISWDRTF
jgi:hypothetical protein